MLENHLFLKKLVKKKKNPNICSAFPVWPVPYGTQIIDEAISFYVFQLINEEKIVDLEC